MTPERTTPDSTLNGQIERAFSSMATFEERFKTAAENQFGSGWTWLCWAKEQQRLEVRSTTDAVIPPLSTHVPLLTVDVWEHAYYLDYRNDRTAYIEQFLDRLINWDTVGERLTEAVGRSEDAGLRQAAR